MGERGWVEGYGCDGKSREMRCHFDFDRVWGVGEVGVDRGEDGVGEGFEGGVGGGDEDSEFDCPGFGGHMYAYWHDCCIWREGRER